MKTMKRMLAETNGQEVLEAATQQAWVAEADPFDWIEVSEMY
jgi:hypothetical protein